MNGKFKSIKYLINKVLKNPLMENINESDLAQYVGDAIRIIGVPKSYTDETCDLTIKDYRGGKLPTDIIYIVQSLFKKTEDSAYYPMRYATSTMASKYHEVGSPDFNQISEFTYTLNNFYIHTNEETGFVKIAYKGLVKDELGFPMIPDNIKFEKAIELYIEWQHFRTLWQLGKLPDKVYQETKQEYEWYVGAAQSAGQLLSLDEAESFANAFSRLLLKPLQQQEYFTNHGSTQYLKNI